MSQTLVITPATIAAVKALSSRAHQSPWTHTHIRKLFHQPKPERTLIVPHGHRVVLTVAQFRPGWLCRQLGVLGPGRWPAIPDVRYLMKACGFRLSLEEALTWAEGREVNILEPLDGDWSPMQSS